jgi:hypothetical protein
MTSQRHGREDDDEEEKFLSLPYKRPKNAAAIARTELKKLVASDCDTQQHSPLFKFLTPELRSKIFDLALQPVLHQPTREVDLIAALQTGKREKLRHMSCTIDTALLRACRLVYLESRFIPVHNCIHDFYGVRWNRFGGVSIYGGFDLLAPLTKLWNPKQKKHPNFFYFFKLLNSRPILDTPHYGEGKTHIRAGQHNPAPMGSSLVHHRGMSPKIQAEVQEVSLYDVSRHTYLTGHDFFGMKPLRPRRVFIACPLGEYPGMVIKKKVPGWHDTLEELTVRIDARPEERKELEEESVPERSIMKLGGGVLALVDAESKIACMWMGLDKKGIHVTWHSVTNVWRAETLL